MDISKIKIGSNTYDIKDAVAREAIGSVTGIMHWLGLTTTALVDGSTTNPITIDENTVTAVNGDVVGYNIDGTRQIEFAWNGTKWQELGSGHGELSYKDTASTTYTPAGTNASSSVTLAGGSTSKLNTTSITPTNGTETVSKVTKAASKLVTTSITPTNGTVAASKVTKAASKLVTTTVRGVASTDTVHDTPTLNTQNIGSASGWSAGTMFTASVAANSEILTLTPGTAPSLTVTTKAVGTSLTAGSIKTFAVADSGTTTVATGSTDNNADGASVITGVNITDVTAAKLGTAITVATGGVASDGDGADVVTGVTISDKTVAKAGTAVTVATGSVATNGGGATVVTALHTGGTAAAQTFTGTAATITVS